MSGRPADVRPRRRTWAFFILNAAAFLNNPAKKSGPVLTTHWEPGCRGSIENEIARGTGEVTVQFTYRVFVLDRRHHQGGRRRNLGRALLNIVPGFLSAAGAEP